MIQIMEKPPEVIAFVGPSGAGKGSIANLLRGDFCRPVSWTSRDMRPYERDGIDYVFKTRGEIEEAYENNILFEINSFNGNLYGAPLPNECGNPQAIYDLNHRGVIELAARIGAGLLVISIIPPSDHSLKERLLQRGESLKSAQGRLDIWGNEEKSLLLPGGGYGSLHSILGRCSVDNICLVNDNLERTVEAAQWVMDTGCMPPNWRQQSNEYGISSNLL